jgi:hypothetical protein
MFQFRLYIWILDFRKVVRDGVHNPIYPSLEIPRPWGSSVKTLVECTMRDDCLSLVSNVNHKEPRQLLFNPLAQELSLVLTHVHLRYDSVAFFVCC